MVICHPHATYYHPSEFVGRIRQHPAWIYLTIGRLRETAFSSWKYPRNFESPRVSSPGIGKDSKMMVMGVDVSAQVSPELQRRMRTGIYLAVTAKRNRRSTTSDLSHQLSSATSTTVSRQTVYRRLGHIGLYARRPVRCVPLTTTHCRLQLTWSREHALWTPQQWSCVMFSLRRV
ncbi:transposable element Tcb1 transposase [Trichonephila clavipes]|nr:transposable element Tcb1 transposase [Trichonephila clavipes]